MSTAIERFDVAIVGGGLVGLSLAVALADSPLRVVLIEAAAPQAALPPSFDDRGLALSIATQRILGGIGVWDSLRDQATAVTAIHVSERGSFAATRLLAGEFGVDALANVVLARDVGGALLKKFAESPRATMLCPARVVDVRTDAASALVTVAHGSVERPLEAALLVVADGAGSLARTRLGVEVRERDYRQTAIVSNVRTSRPATGMAYERFTASGPTALLPQREGRFGLVHVLPTAEAAQALAMPDESFLAAVQSRFGRRAGDFQAVGRRSQYPLRLCVANRVAGRRFVIAGNAAHAIHPNGAQGFNLGIRDVAVLTDILQQAAHDGVDPGADAITSAYAHRCSDDHARTVRLTDTLPSLFYNDWLPHRVLRSLGMMAVEMLPPLKRELFNIGSGMRGSPSRLLRGL
jgi:2-octaprenyl-6-methoxyphenol hydroxylase